MSLLAANHTCNAFCTHGSHCSLIYSSDPDADRVSAQLGFLEQVVVSSIEPAREALPKDQQDQSRLRPLTPIRSQEDIGRHAWLVWWQSLEEVRRAQNDP